MAKTVVFLGAGASRPLGFPLTKDLLRLIIEKIEDKTLFGGTTSLDKFSSSLRKLLPGIHTITPDDLPAITEVLSLVDHALSTVSAPEPHATPQELRKFRVLLERAIVEVLNVPAPSQTGPDPDFRALLKQWLKTQIQRDGQAVGIISTNYDIAVESSLFEDYGYNPSEIANDFDFGASWRAVDRYGTVYHRPPIARFHLYKLHGSLNWLRCDLCEHFYINTSGPIIELAFLEEICEYNTCHCEYAPLRSVIVAPSLVRDIRDVNLLGIWKSALELLRTATEWIIIGYSFPPEDVAIRSLLVRAYNGHAAGPPTIRIVQKENNSGLEARYRAFFDKCQYEVGGLEKLLLP